MDTTSDITSWPTEVLFSFFRSLDPLSLNTFNGVCKRWNQMGQDNELWRQFCEERWQKIPKESDCVKNWLIPVREGVGNKENRIDWRKVYLIRDLADAATEEMHRMMPKPSKLGGRRKGAKKQSATKDFFERGWLEVKDIPAFEEFFTKNISNIEEPENYVAELTTIMNLHLELDLLMLQQVNISRMKYLGIAARFLEELSDYIKEVHDLAIPRFVTVLRQYANLAPKKDVPVEIVSKLTSAMTMVVSSIMEDFDYDSEPLDPLIEYFVTIIGFIRDYPLGDAYNQWIGPDFTEDESSPTHEFEESLNVIASTLKQMEQIEVLWRMVLPSLSMLRPDSSLREYNTILAIMGAVTESIKTSVVENLEQFARAFVLPFFQVDETTPIEKLVPLNYYFSTIFSNLGSAIQLKYLHQLMPVIIKMTSVNHPRVQYHVSQLILGFCEHLVDGEQGFGQYLQELLNKLLVTATTTKNEATREKTVFAISSAVITCRNNFAEVRETVMTAFKNLLATGNKKDREAVIEALSRIGAGVGEQKESIASDVESLYAQVVEDFKNDRPAHEELLIKLTEFGVTTLGKRFTKYLPIVFPVIHQHAVSEVVNIPEGLMGAEGAMEDDNNDDENEENANNDENNEDENEDNVPEIDWEDPNNMLVDEKAITMKTSCVAALGNLVEDLDRTDLLPYFDQINEALRLNVGGQGTIDLILIAAEIYTSFVVKFFPQGMEPEWVAKMKPFLSDNIEAFLGAIESEGLDAKERVLTAFNAMVETLIKNSPADQPFIDNDIIVELLQVCMTCMERLYEHQDLDIEEIHDYGFECVNLFELIAKNTANKEVFIPAAHQLLSFVMSQCVQTAPSENRWADLCMFTTTFEYYGEYFGRFNMGRILSYLWECRVIDSKYTEQAIAYYLSVYARKYPHMLPPDFQPIFDWLSTLLTAERYNERPYVYDNALLAYGYFIERTTQKELFLERMKHYISFFPPTSNGDTDEGNRCLETLGRLLSSPHADDLHNDNKTMALLYKNVKAVLSMVPYNNDANHAIFDPIIADLESSMDKVNNMSFICDKPIKLINHSGDRWQVNEKAIPILSSLKKPIKVLAVAGRYRSGKSHVLNKFLSVQKGGFDLGHTVKGCTKGIWMWGKDTGKEILLALDTEGLNDLTNNPTFDAKLFSLALLLSSYMVLNVPSVLDELVLQQLSFVTELSKIIFAENSNNEDDEDDGTSYKEIFPPVMFLIRDFMLSLEDGQTLDDYLAEALKQKPGRSSQIREKNDIRDSITQAFPVRDIMAIPPPHVDPKVLQNIQEHEDILSEAFKTKVNEVCSALRKNVKVKRAKHDNGVVDISNGAAYLALVQAIVEGLNTKGKIEIPNLFEAVLDVERRKYVTEGKELLLKQYDEISKRLPLNDTDLVDALESTLSEVIDDISQKVINTGMLAQVTDELTDISKQMQESIFSKNKEQSRLICNEIKASVVAGLRKKSSDQAFKSIEEFEEKKQEGVKLLQADGVGPALNEVLKEFDNDCVHLRETLYTQLKLQKVEIEAAESARKHEENQRQIEQLKKESEEAAKQAKLREEALKTQNEVFAKKLEEDMRRWNEEKEELKKQFEREIAQAKKVGDTRLLEIAEQQYKAYSRKKEKCQKGSSGGRTVWVNPYTRSDGVKVKGHYRHYN